MKRFCANYFLPPFVCTLGRTGRGAAVRVAFKLLAFGRAKPERCILLALNRASGGRNVTLPVSQVLPAVWIRFPSTGGAPAFLGAFLVVAVVILILVLLALRQSLSASEGLSTVRRACGSHNRRNAWPLRRGWSSSRGPWS